MKTFAAAAACLLWAIPALGQRVTSDLLGTVADPSGGVIVGAKVVVIRPDTAESRETSTGPQGEYRVPGLGAGVYEIRFEKDGFKTEVRKDVELLVNQQATVNATLQIGEMREEVTVEGDVSLLDAASSGLSGVVTGPVLHELPLNGRDLFQLTLLKPGVLPVTSAGPNPFAEGGTGKASVEGARPTMNNVTLDGADINDPVYAMPPGGVAGVQLGVEAVREYRVLLNNYSAEFGRNAGANVQYISRSGANQLHGSLFEFHRNAALDARNFFDLGPVPGFVRNQFGGALSGPVRKNKTFLFATLENLMESRSINVGLSVPDENARRGLLPAPGGGLVNVGVDPRIAPFLNLYPSPNGASIGGGLAGLFTSRRQPTTEHYGLLRLDHNFSASDQLFLRYAIDDSHSNVPFASTVTPGFPSEREIRNQYGMLSWQRIVGPRLLNEAKLHFSRSRMATRESFTTPLSISLSPGRPLGAVSVSGLPQLGSSLVSPVVSIANTYELIDNLSVQLGGHTIKMGADFKRIESNGLYDALKNGSYIFSDLTAFGLPAQSSNPALEFFLHAIPLVYLGVDPALADSHRGYRQSYLGLYAQDDWRVSPTLTVNLGLRLEHWSNPGETNGRLSNIRNAATSTHPEPGSIWESTPKGMWSPRLGFAWKPSVDSRLAVRGGAGMMRDQLWGNLYGNTRFYEPNYRALQYILPAFQAPPKDTQSLIGFAGPPSVIGIFGITWHPDFPYYAQYNLNVQRELAGGVLVQAAYLGSRGIHLPRTGEANPFSLALGRRLNPALGSLVTIVTDGQSFYHSGQLSLSRRLAKGLTWEASYTFSKSIDDQSGTFPSDFTSESGLSQDFFNRKGDRARSSFDRRHALVMNALYDLPLGHNKLLSGWSAGGIVSLLSGAPFTANLGSFNNSVTQALTSADRPDIRAGANACSTTTGDPGRWFDPSIFALPAPGRFGNAGRNILCGPALQNVDLLVTRQIRISERTHLGFRAEFFNLFNHANFDSPVNTQGPTGGGGNGDAVFVGRQGGTCNPASDPAACGAPAPDAGRIFRTVTTSRQIQFGLRLSF